MRQLGSWAVSACVGFVRACMVAFVSMLIPVVWAGAVAVCVWWRGSPWSWTAPLFWAAVGTLALARPVCRMFRSLAARREIPGLPILILSQYVEQLYARELLADGAGGIGYFLKESVFDADQFIDAVQRVAAGGTAMDPAVIAKLLSSGSSHRRLDRLTEREHSVLALMAEGLSNQAIGQRLFLSESAIRPDS